MNSLRYVELNTHFLSQDIYFFSEFQKCRVYFLIDNFKSVVVI